MLKHIVIWLTILLSQLQLYKAVITLQQRPVIILHGMLNDCRSSDNTKFARYRYICLEVGNGLSSLQKISKQAKKGCRIIKTAMRRNPNRYANGFYLIGFSMGGLVARYMFQFCPGMSQKIKRLITSGAPNLSISKLPDISDPNLKYDLGWMKEMVVNIYKNRKKIHAKDIKNIIKHRDFSSSVTDIFTLFNKRSFIQQELEGDRHASDKYTSLEMFMAIGNIKDPIVRPFGTATFGARYNSEKKRLQPFRQTNHYLNNIYGFKDMYDTGRYMNCANNSTHNTFTFSTIEDINSFVSDDCEFNEKQFKDVPVSKLYSLCLYKNLIRMNERKNKDFKCEPSVKQLMKKPQVVEYLSYIASKDRLKLI